MDIELWCVCLGATLNPLREILHTAPLHYSLPPIWLISGNDLLFKTGNDGTWIDLMIFPSLDFSLLA